MSETAESKQVSDKGASPPEANKEPVSPAPPSVDSPAPSSPATTPSPSKTKADEENGKSTPDGAASENGGETPGTPKAITLREQFRAFSKFGDTKSDGKYITLSQSDKWMKQAKVISPKTITTTDTGIYFKKFKQTKISFKEFEQYLDEISKAKNIDSNEVKGKLKNCGQPGLSGTTSVVKSSAVDRLTDTKKFTGSHKLRFDSTGRGRGLHGRKDVKDTSGYVMGYKNKDSYDKHH